MLTENDVVEAVCGWLQSAGYTIESRCHTTQVGDDIVASRNGVKLSVEAKGETSARLNSAKYGHPFDSAQCRVHVAEAAFKAIQVLSRTDAGSRLVAGIALPDNEMHRRLVQTGWPVLSELGVVVFFVGSSGDVSTMGSWPVQ